MLKEQYKPIFPTLDFPVHGLLPHLRNRVAEFTISVSDALKRMNQVRSMHPDWDTVSEAEHFATTLELRSTTAVDKLLRNNAFPYLLEYAVGTIVDVFEMPIDPTAGVLGTEGTYEKGIEEIADGFARRQKSLGKKIVRANLESINWRKVKDWSLSSEVGSVLTWHSPPYLDKKTKHSFIFAYHKVSPTLAKVYQFRCWPTLKQHKDIQKQIHTKFGIGDEVQYDKRLPENFQIINSILEYSPSLATPILEQLSSDSLIQDIESIIYENKNTWHTQAEDMPLVDMDAFHAIRERLTDLYIQEVTPLFLSVPQVSSLDSPEWQAYIKTKEFKHLIVKLDMAFAILLSQPLKKWVEVTNQRKPRKLIHKIRYAEMNAKKKIQSFFGPLPPTIAEKPLDQVEKELLTLCKIKIKHELGEKLSKSEAAFFNFNAGGLITLSGDSSGAGGGCGESASISDSVSGDGVGESSGVSGGGSASEREMTALADGMDEKDIYVKPEKIKAFSAERKLAKRAVLQKFVSIELHRELFYVHPDQEKAYKQKCTKPADKVIGPCGEPLPDMFCVPESLYLEQLAATYDFDGLEQSLVNKVHTEKEKAEIKQLFSVLMKTLMPETVGVEEALLGNKQIVRTPLQSSELMNKLVKELQHSDKPAIDLQIRIQDLDPTQRASLVETYIEVPTAKRIVTKPKNPILETNVYNYQKQVLPEKVIVYSN